MLISEGKLADVEFAVGIVVLIASFVIGATVHNVAWIVPLLIMVLVAVSFLNLSKLRTFPQDHRPSVKIAMWGGFLIPIAQFIEQVLNVKGQQ